MRGACLTENVLYHSKISCDDKKYKSKLYKGICQTTFKKHEQILKNLLIRKKPRTTQNSLLNTGS